MKLTDKINFRQPKYMLPLVVYLPLLGTAYFVFDMFDTKIDDTKSSKMQTTEYLNPDLPQAQIRGGDGIGGKYENMLNAYGKIEDHSAVNNIERNNTDEKETYESKYSEEELKRLEEESAQELAKLESERNQLINAEDDALSELHKALAAARLQGQQGLDSNTPEENPQNENLQEHKNLTVNGQIDVNDKVKKAISDEEEANDVVKKVKTSSDYFNTLAENEKEPSLIKAIIDEDIKATDGSRVRLRLLDDIEINELVVTKGSYLYATMSGFGSQRVKGTIKSLLVQDELVKINLSIYDTDGMEGLYVPSSSFRETTKEVTSGAVTGNVNMNNTNSGSSFAQWGMQTMTNAYQKTSNAIGKAIKQNKVKLKYGTSVYLINGKENKNK